MKTIDNFDELGKKGLFKTPADFFENITTETLIKARNRGRKAVIRKTINIITSAAAVLIFVLGTYSLLNDNNTSHTFKNADKEAISENYTDKSPENTNGKIGNKTELPNKEQVLITNSETNETEAIEEVLTSISDNELNAISELIFTELLIDDLKNIPNE